MNHLAAGQPGRRTAPPSAEGGGGQDAGGQDSGRAATDAVTELYAAHALGLTRLAHVMLGDRAAAEDVVHDAFAGLYRRWPHLADHGKAPAYLRSAVLNGCRSAARRARRAVPPVFVTVEHAPSAESALLDGQARDVVLAALRGLPVRQREALVLRFYLDLPDSEIAAAMSVGESTVRSTVHRGLAALERILSKELS
jgi:RNA polymerase sigma-70 factor (sigma-E family)